MLRDLFVCLYHGHLFISPAAVPALCLAILPVPDPTRRASPPQVDCPCLFADPRTAVVVSSVRIDNHRSFVTAIDSWRAHLSIVHTVSTEDAEAQLRRYLRVRTFVATWCPWGPGAI
jgi:hypothetical protein